MAKSTMLSLDGLKELERELKSLSDRVGRSVLNKAMEEAAAPMRDAAKSRVKRRSGNLAKSIIIGKHLNRRQKKAMRVEGTQKHAIQLYMGPSRLKGMRGRHGHLVEFGTKPHIAGGRFKGAKHPGARANPFMRPAWDAEAEATVRRLGPLLWARIRKSQARAAKAAARKPRNG